MKIIKLRFKNLNSLAGEWSIDFSAPEYISDGIFAISGPTGAGKSTILDAICLALYGRTPRLKNISKTTNEIMSRQTGVCFAEIVFETDEGRFRAYWSQRRSREKAGKPLQDPEHELSKADTGEILASQIKTVRTAIEERTGMDYDRFVRSMMLAQGDFAAFLQATANERAPILEQITGTEIYSVISKHVFERQRAEKSKLDLLLVENKGIVLLSPEEENQIKQNLEAKNAGKATLSSERDKLEASVSWLKAIDNLKSGLASIEQEETALSREIAEFMPKRQVLRDARRAADLDGEYATLTALRAQQRIDMTLLNDLSLKVPELNERQTAAKKTFDHAVKLHTEAKKASESLQKLTIKVRSMDQEIAQVNSGMLDIKNIILRLTGEKEKETAKKTSVEKSIAALRGELEKADEYLASSRADSSLISEMAGIKAAASGLIEAGDAVTQAGKNLEISGKLLTDKLSETKSREEEVAEAVEHQKKFSDAIKKIRKEISLLPGGLSQEELQQKKDRLILHLAELRKISDLETERRLLEDNKPCPLCGSLHHPYAEGNIPASTETERELSDLADLIKKLGELNKQVTDLQAKEKISADETVRIANLLNLAKQQVAGIGDIISSQRAELEKCNKTYTQKAASLKKMVEVYCIQAIPEKQEEINNLIAVLDGRKNLWHDREKRRGEIDGEIRSKLADLKVCDEIIKTRESDISIRKGELDSSVIKLDSLKAQRLEAFGEKSADAEEEASRGLLQRAEDAEIKARETLLQCGQKLEENTRLISGLQVQISTRLGGLDGMETRFAGRIAKAGFTEEDKYVSCRLPAEEREQLETEAVRLDTRKTTLETRKADIASRLREETAKNLTDETQEALTARLIEKNMALDAILLEIGALGQKIKGNNEARVKGEQIGLEIDLQNKVLERWNKLNSLIGSADGKKYRNFAQGLTFEIMVSYANVQLAKLNDRYLLIRDKLEPLELNVTDNYQAGEIRSTKNLSGGESFIVSLALALGLSRMSGRNVRVDSLFLDEGFGSLDEDTLETALGTLASLRQDGKMIGVISHVGAMKERINTKIIVQPIREGRSILSGPGCQETGR
jgi:exonuclease SbcC